MGTGGGGIATHRAPLQALPVTQIPAEMREKSEFPLSKSSNEFAPKLIVRGTPGEDAAVEKTVPFCSTDGSTGLLIAQLTVIEQVLAPIGMSQLAGTTKELTDGAGGGKQQTAPPKQSPDGTVPVAQLDGS